MSNLTEEESITLKVIDEANQYKNNKSIDRLNNALKLIKSMIFINSNKKGD